MTRPDTEVSEAELRWLLRQPLLPLPIPSLSTGGVLYQGKGKLMGYSCMGTDAANGGTTHTRAIIPTTGNSIAIYNGPALYFGAAVMNLDTVAANIEISDDSAGYNIANVIDTIYNVAPGAYVDSGQLANSQGVYCANGIRAHADAQPTTTGVTVVGFYRPVAAVASAISLYDGENTGGLFIAGGPVPAATGLRMWFGPHGLDLQHGLAHSSPAGVSGVAWVLPHRGR